MPHHKSKPRKRHPCKKISLQWNTGEESQMIKLIEKFPCLYDTECAQAKEKHSRRDAWQSVAATIAKEHATPAECQAKWCSIRGSYRRMLNGGQVPLPDEELPKHAWPHLRALEFLRNNMKTVRMLADTENGQDEEAPVKQESDTENGQDDDEASVKQEYDSDPDTSTNDEPVEEPRSPTPPPPPPPAPKRRGGKRLKRKVVVITPNEVVQTELGDDNAPDTPLESSAPPNKLARYISEDDEFGIFGKFVASELRTIDLAAARALKLKLNIFFSNQMQESLAAGSPKRKKD